MIVVVTDLLSIEMDGADEQWVAGVNETECAKGEGTRARGKSLIGAPTLKSLAHIYSRLQPKSCILVFSGVGVLAKRIHCVRHKLLDGGLQ